MEWFRKAVNMSAAVSERPADNVPEQAIACMDAFQSHWLQIHDILRSEHPTVEMQTTVFRHLEQIVVFLSAECATCKQFSIGPMLEFAFNENIFSMVVSWATDCVGQSRLFALKNVFKIYDMIISNTTPCIIVHKPILRPLLFALEECDSADTWLLNDIREPMVFLLHQVCTKIAQKEEWSLLEFFFQKEMDHIAPRFLVFTLLIPFLYFGGRIELLVRDAMLLVLSVSNQLDCAAEFLANETNFCPVLASGLAAVYSSLPRKLPSNDAYEDWCRVTDSDLHLCAELLSFRNALEFCNAVAQASHPKVVGAFIKYFYNGFLLSVFKPAILESTSGDLLAVIPYLELTFRCLSESVLRKSLIRFVVVANASGLGILEMLVHRIEKCDQLTNVCLALFDTVLTLNSEVIMFELIFRYLIPLHHVFDDKRMMINSDMLFDDSFNFFLATAPLQHLQTADKVSLNVDFKTNDDSYMEDEGAMLNRCEESADPMLGIFQYCKLARHQFNACCRDCRQWHFKYDAVSPGTNNKTNNGMEIQNKSDTTSERLSDVQLGISSNCAFRQSRSKAYYAKKKLDKFQQDHLCITSALDLAITGTDSGIENLENMFFAFEDKSKLMSFESETFLNLYCSKAVPSSFMQLTFVENSASVPQGSKGQQLAQGANDQSQQGIVDICQADDLDAFEAMVDNFFFSADQTGTDVHDAVSYINYIYDKLLLPYSAPLAGNAGQRRPFVRKLQLDSDDFICDLNEVQLNRVATVEDCISAVLGPLLSLLLAKLERMLQNTLCENLLLTGLLAKLAYFPHRLLSSLLLSTFPMFKSNVRPLAQILSVLSEDVKVRLVNIEHLPIRLQFAKEVMISRHKQIPNSPKATVNDHSMPSPSRSSSSYSRLGQQERACLASYGYGDVVHPLLQTAIVLDEFCKEMAAIAMEQWQFLCMH